MERVISQDGTQVSFERYGTGPALVLVHGGFSDHQTNWMYVKDALRERYTVSAVARRGRGQTDRTDGHGIEDEAADVVAVVRSIDEPVFLLGHSHGAVCALNAAAIVPERIAGLVLYEAPWPSLVADEILQRLVALGAHGDWNTLVETFLREVLLVPAEDVTALRATPDWQTWITDAESTLSDFTSLRRWSFTAERYAGLDIPVLLLVGEHSPRRLYLTDALAGVLPNARVETLAGQAHEGMTTAPELFVETVVRFAGSVLGTRTARAAGGEAA